MGRSASRTSSDTEARERIVAAAKRRFAAHGFDAASTRRIAEDAGVAQSLLLYHFASKELLWRAVMDREFMRAREIWGARAEAADADSDGDVRTAIMASVGSFVRFCAEDSDLHRLMTHEGGAPSPRLDWLVETHLRGPFAHMTALLARGQAEGIVRAGNPTLLYYAIIAIAGTTYSLAPEIARLDPKLAPLASDQIESLVAALLFV